MYAIITFKVKIMGYIFVFGVYLEVIRYIKELEVTIQTKQNDKRIEMEG
jgi:hypothetical protein